MKQLHIGSNIRKIRTLKGYTEEYLASKLEMSTGGYCKLEKKDDLPLKYIHQIAEILEVNRVCIIEFDEDDCLQAYMTALENGNLRKGLPKKLVSNGRN